MTEIEYNTVAHSYNLLKGECRCGVNLLYLPIFAKIWPFKNRFPPPEKFMLREMDIWLKNDIKTIIG